MRYVIYEKSYIERFGRKIDDEINIGDTDSLIGVIDLLNEKRDIKTSKRAIYRSIQNKTPLKDKYFIFKMKS